MTTNEERVEKY